MYKYSVSLGSGTHRPLVLYSLTGSGTHLGKSIFFMEVGGCLKSKTYVVAQKSLVVKVFKVFSI